jgi:hypothetical protein
VEREFMKEVNWKDCCCISFLLTSECKIMDNSPLSEILRVLLALIALAVSFSVSDLPHRTNKLQSTADKKWRNIYFIFKIQTLFQLFNNYGFNSVYKLINYQCFILQLVYPIIHVQVTIYGTSERKITLKVTGCDLTNPRMP